MCTFTHHDFRLFRHMVLHLQRGDHSEAMMGDILWIQNCINSTSYNSKSWFLSCKETFALLWATYQFHGQFFPLIRIGNCIIWLAIAHHGDCQFKVFGIEIDMQIIVGGQIEDLNAFSLTLQCIVFSVVMCWQKATWWSVVGMLDECFV